MNFFEYVLRQCSDQAGSDRISFYETFTWPGLSGGGSLSLGDKPKLIVTPQQTYCTSYMIVVNVLVNF